MYRLLRSNAVRMGASRFLYAANSRPLVVSRLGRSFSEKASYKADLLATVEREYKEESTGYAIEPELKEIRGIVEDDGWKIVDEEGLTRMFKNTSGFKIQLSFHCQDQIRDQEADEPEYEEPAQDGEENEEYDNESDHVRFSITATPTNGAKTLYFSCLTKYALAHIEGVALIEPDNIEKVHSSAEAFSHKAYHGPDFSELAEDMTENFMEFMYNDLSVNGNVATFVAMYADHKEQEQYTKFLKDMKTVLASN